MLSHEPDLQDSFLRDHAKGDVPQSAFFHEDGDLGGFDRGDGRAVSGVPSAGVKNTGSEIATVVEASLQTQLGADEKVNSFGEIAGYNNYYEFSTEKSAVAAKAKNFVTNPWTVEVSGLLGKPRVFGLEDLLKMESVERT